MTKILKSNLSKEQDPTMQGENRLAAEKKISGIANDYEQSIFKMIDGVPFEIVNGERQYRQPDGESMNNELGVALLFLMMRGGQFFTDQHIYSSMTAGAVAIESSINRQISSAGGDNINADSVINNSIFLAAISENQRQTRAFMELEAGRSSNLIADIILSGMAAGLSIREIKRRVRRVIEAMKARMARITRTQINQANDNSRMTYTAIAASIAGGKPMVRHISALLPTTREHHAARHNKIYTVNQQRAWWSTGSNRINCYCSVEPVISLKRK